MRIVRRAIESFDPEGQDHHTINRHIEDVVKAINDISYGSMYNNDAPVTINVATTGTMYQVTNMTAGTYLEGFTFAAADDELTCKSPGAYLVVWSMSMYGAQGRDIEGLIGIDDAAQGETGCHSDMPIANARTSIGGQGIIRLNRGSTVQLLLHSHDTTGNITVEHANVTLLKIDD